MQHDSLLGLLEEAIDLIDKLEKAVYALEPGSQVTPGAVYQLYSNLVLLREKIVEARLKASSCVEE